MPRNSAGSWSAPAGNPVVSGTAISTVWANALVSDIATEITDSLSRSGRGGMTAPIRVPDGTVAAPTMAFTSEPGSGLYRAGAGDVRLARLGVDVLKALAGGVGAAVWSTLTAASAIVRGTVADGASAIGVVLDNGVTLANAAAKLVSIQNNGVEKANVDLLGNVHGQNLWQSSYLSADAAANTGAFPQTALSFAAAAGAEYEVEFWGYLTYSVATAIGIGFSYSGTAAAAWEMATATGVFTSGNLLGSNLNTLGGMNFTPTAGTYLVFRVKGYVKTTTAGNLSAAFGNAAASSLVMKQGTSLRWRRMDSGGFA